MNGVGSVRSSELVGVVTRRQAVTLHVAVGVLSVAVCMLAALGAWICHEGIQAVRHHGREETWVDTPWFLEFALAVGAALGVAASVIWCSRVLANQRRPRRKFKPVGLAILLALGATALLHPALGVFQGVIRGMPIPWPSVIGFGVAYGLICALISGSVAGAIAYYVIAAELFGRDDT